MSGNQQGQGQEETNCSQWNARKTLKRTERRLLDRLQVQLLQFSIMKILTEDDGAKERFLRFSSPRKKL